MGHSEFSGLLETIGTYSALLGFPRSFRTLEDSTVSLRLILEAYRSMLVSCRLLQNLPAPARYSPVGKNAAPGFSASCFAGIRMSW